MNKHSMGNSHPFFNGFLEALLSKFLMQGRNQESNLPWAYTKFNALSVVVVVKGRATRLKQPKWVVGGGLKLNFVGLHKETR